MTTLLWAAMLILAPLGEQSPARRGAERIVELPAIVVEHYGAETREQIASALAEARRQPRDPGRTGRLGMTLHAYDEFEAAEICYRRAYALGGEFQWLYLRGVALASLGRHEEAAVVLRQATGLRSDYWQARARLADSLLAGGDAAGAAAICEELARRQPELSLIHYWLGRALAAQRDFVAAERALRQAISISPGFGTAHYALAMACRELGRRDEAATHLRLSQQYQLIRPTLPDPLVQGVAELNRGAANHLRKGVEFESAGRLAEAIDEHEKALKINPRFEQVHLNLITLYARAGESGKCERQYLALLEINPSLAESHYNYGVMLAGTQRIAEAEKAFRRCLAIDPRHPEANYNLGGIEEMRQNYDEALTRYQLAATGAPRNREAGLQFARMLIFRGRLTEAIEALRRTVVPEDAETPRYLYALGATLARAGEREQALAAMREARRLAQAFSRGDLLPAIDRDLRQLERP